MRILLVSLAILAAVAFAPAALAQSPTNPNLLVQPHLQIPVPGLQITKAVMKGTNFSAPYIAQYIEGMYRFLLGVVGVVAAVSLVWAGFRYLTAGGVEKNVTIAKTRIRDSILGLVLAYGSYLMLYLINPNLVQFSNFSIVMARPETFSAEDQEDAGDIATAPPSGGATGGTIAAGPVCHTADDCRAICRQDAGTWPAAVQGMLLPSDAVFIPETRGLSNPTGQKASTALSNALVQAANIAVSVDPSYQLIVTSGYRPLDKQIRLVCDKISAADHATSDAQKNAILSSIGVSVAWPGGSNHGYGNAVDLELAQGGSLLTESGNVGAQSNTQYRAGSLILDQIMTRAGFRRYSAEMWHYEVSTTSPCRCQYPSCPWPPQKAC